MKKHQNKQLFYLFYKEHSLKTKGDVGLWFYEPTIFSLQFYAASVLVSIWYCIHSGRKRHVRRLSVTRSATPLAKQSKCIWGQFVSTTTTVPHLASQASGSGKRPLPHRKAKIMKAIIIMWLGSHERRKATEKYNSSDLYSFLSWALGCMAERSGSYSSTHGFRVNSTRVWCVMFVRRLVREGKSFPLTIFFLQLSLLGNHLSCPTECVMLVSSGLETPVWTFSI